MIHSTVSKGALLMRRLMMAAALAAITLMSVPASALEIPLSTAGAKAAIAEGASYKSLADAHAGMRAWKLNADADTPAPAGTTVTVETPYFLLTAISALSKAQKKSLSDDLVTGIYTLHTLRFSAELVSTTPTANDAAGIVIRQDGRIVQPVGNTVKHNDQPNVFKQTLESEFDLKTLNPNKPMTVIVANVALPAIGTAAPRHEIHYTLNPALVR